MKATEFLEYLSLKERLIYILFKLINKVQPHEYKYLTEIHSQFIGAKNLGFDITQNRNLYILKKNEECIYLRKKGSDLSVFNQVFIEQEYGPLIKLAIDNQIEILNIIDAGSNIGLTSLKLLDSFPNAKIICLEPDIQNFSVLETNLSKAVLSQKCFLLQKALWSSNQMLSITSDFRDGKDWSRQVTNTKENKVEKRTESTTIANIIERFKIDEISILKMDIEGSESEIFSERSNLDFLNFVKIIALEIHDEVANRNEIHEILKAYNFFIISSGELTIGISKHAINKCG